MRSNNWEFRRSLVRGKWYWRVFKNDRVVARGMKGYRSCAQLEKECQRIGHLIALDNRGWRKVADS